MRDERLPVRPTPIRWLAILLLPLASVGCCISPNGADLADAPAPLPSAVAEPVPGGMAAEPIAEPSVAPDTALTTPLTSAPDAPALAAAPVDGPVDGPALAAPAAPPAAPAAPPAAPAPVAAAPTPDAPTVPPVVAPADPPMADAPPPVGALLAGGTQYAYEDLGITLTVPAGWTQQLMTGGVIALFSDDYPASGRRERGALMLISPHQGTLPADDAALLALLRDGLDPAATVEAGPIRLPVGDKQAAQVIARAVDADQAQYQIIHSILQTGGRAVSVKAIAFDGLQQRKPVFDAVKESIGLGSPVGAG